jgi:hypothetical protein
MTQTQPKLQLIDDMWVVRIEQPNGTIQVYRCATEAQAKQMAMVLVPPALS